MQSRQADFGRGRNIGEIRQALGRERKQRTRGAAIDRGANRTDRNRNGIDMAGDHVGDRRRYTTIRHMHQFNADFAG